ncbi:type II toxin-antitoxin system RelE/ParE family toxin [Orbus wheelerorum]|uniref:type II toxin-antitoxin system RelE family toxin n=1 Tax=Orbus wheelerorum TaxID=3074111 RepID=UPI00370D45CB
MDNYTVKFKESVEKKLNKLDKDIRIMLLGWIKKHLVNTTSPRTHGKALKGALGELWCYRVGNHRIIAKIQDSDIKIIIVVNIGHRKDIYK